MWSIHNMPWWHIYQRDLKLNFPSSNTLGPFDPWGSNVKCEISFYIGLWPLAHQGQMSQAHIAHLKMTDLSWNLLPIIDQELGSVVIYTIMTKIGHHSYLHMCKATSLYFNMKLIGSHKNIQKSHCLVIIILSTH